MPLVIGWVKEGEGERFLGELIIQKLRVKWDHNILCQNKKEELLSDRLFLVFGDFDLDMRISKIYSEFNK